jgi:uncharacterized membrane protein
MRKYIAVFAISAIIVHIAFVAFLPKLIMVFYFYTTTSAGYEENKIYHAPPINSSQRTVVLPSPNLLYSFCIYDVSEGPLLIEAKVPENTYWSVSFYDSFTNNFFTINDRQVKGMAKILLVKEGTEVKTDAIVVRAKDEHGFVLFRTFIPDKALIPQLDALRQRWKCEPTKTYLFD